MAGDPAGGTAARDIYDLAELYDTIYRGRGKDYARESAAVIELIRASRPSAASLLDVGCGTGSHLRYFAEEFKDVAGIDLSEKMLAVARRRLPGVPVRTGDMRSFSLGRRFDVITCLFSAVGNLETPDELFATLRSFGRHLEPGGVIVLEPWWFPDTFLPGHVAGDVFTDGGRTIARVSHSIREGDASRMQVHYVVASAESGIWHFDDVHVMALYAKDEYEAAFAAAGCSVRHLDFGAGPGLFVGVRDL